MCIHDVVCPCPLEKMTDRAAAGRVECCDLTVGHEPGKTRLPAGARTPNLGENRGGQQRKRSTPGCEPLQRERHSDWSTLSRDECTGVKNQPHSAASALSSARISSGYGLMPTSHAQLHDPRR